MLVLHPLNVWQLTLLGINTELSKRKKKQTKKKKDRISLPNVCKCAQKLRERNQNILRENEKEKTGLGWEMVLD